MRFKRVFVTLNKKVKRNMISKYVNNSRSRRELNI